MQNLNYGTNLGVQQQIIDKENVGHFSNPGEQGMPYSGTLMQL